MLVRLSTLGLYNYDQTLFDNMQLPAGVNRNYLVSNILEETAELNTVYPDPRIFKTVLSSWSARKLPIWEKLYATTQFEYNPIDNYDRTETETIEIALGGSETETGENSETGTRLNTGTQKHERDITNSVTKNETMTGTGTIEVASSELSSETPNKTDTTSNTAFNTTTFQDVQKVVTSGNISRNDSKTDTTTRNTTDTVGGNTSTTGSDDTTRTDNLAESVNSTGENTVTRERELTDSRERTTRAHGNIGVTTTQQMIEQERAIDTFDIYQIITDDFIDHFCIGVY